MPPTPSLIMGSNSPGLRHESSDIVPVPRHTPESSENLTPSHHGLTLPSLNDYRTVSSTNQSTSLVPSAAAIPTQNYVPITLKSVRAAKSRNKLRQESQISTISASEYNMLPNSSLTTQSNEDAGSTLDSLSLNHHLPSPFDLTTFIESDGLQHHLDRLTSARRREHSTASASGPAMQVLPRPIIKDKSAKDRIQRESWMSEPPGITVSGSGSGMGATRPVSSHHHGNHSISPNASPITPQKSMARSNSAKKHSKSNRHSTLDNDHDVLAPRSRKGNNADQRSRRQSGGQSNMLHTLDTCSSVDAESDDYDDSDIDEPQHYTSHLQEQYSLLQKSHNRLSTSDNSIKPRSNSVPLEDNPSMAYFTKRAQRKSLGDELNIPHTPEKNANRKRVSTMETSTLVPVSSISGSNVTPGNNTSDSITPVIRPNAFRPIDRRARGSIGPNALSFEPLFALNSGTKNTSAEALVVSKDGSSNRLSSVSDADWGTVQSTVESNQQGVSVLDWSKRELTEIPSGLPTTITHLRLAHNMIQILAPIDSLTVLHNLQVLDLCDNQLETIPPEISLLSSLKELHLSENKLWKLPDNPVIGRLKSLKQLDARHNQLKSLPPQLCMLSSTLTVLLVDGNKFVQSFLDLLQPLMTEDKEPTSSGRQSFLSDDPYADPQLKNMGVPAQKVVGAYEPWRRSVTPNSVRRIGGGGGSQLSKRRSHGDLMTFIGLQKRDEDDPSTGILDQIQRSNTISGSSRNAALNSGERSRRERSASASTVTPAADTAPSSSGSPHPLSFKMFKNIRKSSRSSLRDNQASAKHDLNKRNSIGSEAGLSEFDLDPQDAEKSASKASTIGAASGKKTGNSIQWMRDRFHKRTNSNELGVLPSAHASATSLNADADDGDENYQARDSGYGIIGGSGAQLNVSLGSTPDLGETLSQGKGSGVIDSRFQNKSTGHLPYGTALSPKESQLSSSLDPGNKRERDYRYSVMSIESHMTQGTENDYEHLDTDAIAYHMQQQQQHHRLSSVYSPTTPLPSSPIIGGGSVSSPGVGQWSPACLRFGQNAVHIRALMQYLKDLYDLDPDSSEWSDVIACRRVWSEDASNTAGPGATAEENTEEISEEKHSRDEELKMTKLQAQALRRRRIIDEIMATEKSYVEGLKGLVEIYLTPATQVMPQSEHKTIFSNAQLIHNFHSDHFLPALQTAYDKAFSSADQQKYEQNSALTLAVTSPTSPIPTGLSLPISNERASATADGEEPQQKTPTTSTSPSMESIKMAAADDRIGRVFKDHEAYMKMYSFFSNNYDNANRAIQTQLTTSKHKKKMREFYKRCKTHPNHSQLDINGYLLLPIQRIPRYKMLLQDLLENTWPDHPDYQDIAKGLEKITGHAGEMNERKRQHENHEKVLLVQNRIINSKAELVQPFRKVVREGMLHLIRVITRNVVMGVEKAVLPPTLSDHSIGATSTTASIHQVGDQTVHHLLEETVERSYLFILFNDILIQCNQVTPKGGAVGSGALSPSSSSASGAGSSYASSGKNLELLSVLQLESRLRPAEVIGQDVLRVVDDKMVLYLTGDKDVIHSWRDDINSRW
ncbi:hypothetical protein BGZ76_011256 [Entomortierella beljakovae]|nr:hypothetical protein BGZ76_011256 [Entomortierella beljakovae]